MAKQQVIGIWVIWDDLETFATNRLELVSFLSVHHIANALLLCHCSYIVAILQRIACSSRKSWREIPNAIEDTDRS